MIMTINTQKEKNTIENTKKKVVFDFVNSIPSTNRVEPNSSHYSLKIQTQDFKKPAIHHRSPINYF